MSSKRRLTDETPPKKGVGRRGAWLFGGAFAGFFLFVGALFAFSVGVYSVSNPLGIGVLSVVLSLSFGYYLGESLRETDDLSSSFASGFLLVTMLATVINLVLSYFLTSASAILLLIYAGILLLGSISSYGIGQFTDDQLGRKIVFKRGMDLFCTKLSWAWSWTYLTSTFALPLVNVLLGQMETGIVSADVLIASTASVVFLLIIIFVLAYYWLHDHW